MDTWATQPGNVSVETLLAKIGPIIQEADGITVTGGEPFDQPEALLGLLRGWRQAGGGDVLVFSGYPFEKLIQRLEKFNNLVDCLVAEPFDASAGQSLMLRGSDNQRLVYLTELGRQRFEQFERKLRPEDRALDVLFDDASGEVFMAGIPRPGDIRRLAALLDAQGNKTSVTEDARERLC
jgi:anaerobic ribonucleoside-triphosphate reductase activating protein